LDKTVKVEDLHSAVEHKQTGRRPATCRFIAASAAVASRRPLWKSLAFVLWYACVKLLNILSAAFRNTHGWKQHTVHYERPYRHAPQI